MQAYFRHQVQYRDPMCPQQLDLLSQYGDPFKWDLCFVQSSPWILCCGLPEPQFSFSFRGKKQTSNLHMVSLLHHYRQCAEIALKISAFECVVILFCRIINVSVVPESCWRKQARASFSGMGLTWFPLWMCCWGLRCPWQQEVGVQANCCVATVLCEC